QRLASGVGVHMSYTQEVGAVRDRRKSAGDHRIWSARVLLASSRCHKSNGGVGEVNRPPEEAGGEVPRRMAAGRGGEGYSGTDLAWGKARELHGRSAQVVRALS